MITIDTKAYLFRMFIDNFYFCFIFFSLYCVPNNLKKSLYILTVLILTFFLDILTSLSDLFPIVIGYYFFKVKKRNYYLLNSLIYSVLLNYLFSTISFWIIINIFTDKNTKGFAFIIGQLLIKLILITVCMYVFNKFKFNAWNERNSSRVTFLLLVYLLGVALLISFTAHYFNFFDQFIIGFIIFFIVQSLFLVAVISFILDKQKKDLTKKFNEQELVNLKKYTDVLEKKQEDLDKFRHDYKNILLSFKAKTKDNSPDLYEQIVQLESYSNQHMENSSKNYVLYQNIHNPYLKSLIISKLDEAMTLGLFIQFECAKEIEHIPINIFDSLRIIGILLDNAIEASKESYQKTLSLMIYKDNSQIEFVIENSCKQEKLEIHDLQKKYYSSKQNHSGLGLYTVNELNKKYPNMFFNSKLESNNFIVQLIFTY